MPIKLITLVRSDDVAAWRSALVDRIAGGAPGLVRLLFNEVLPVEVRATGGPAPEHWDAVVESWFDTRADLDIWAGSAPGGAVLADLIVDQKLIHDSGIRPLPAKVIVAFRRRPDITRAQAQAHWRGRHVEVGLVEHNATDFLRLYFQNHVIDGNPVRQAAHDYDGLPEFWVDQEELAMVGPDSTVMRAIAEDEVNFLEPGTNVTMLLAEEELFARDPTHAGWDARQPA